MLPPSNLVKTKLLIEEINQLGAELHDKEQNPSVCSMIVLLKKSKKEHSLQTSKSFQPLYLFVSSQLITFKTI